MGAGPKDWKFGVSGEVSGHGRRQPADISHGGWTWGWERLSQWEPQVANRDGRNEFVLPKVAGSVPCV